MKKPPVGKGDSISLQQGHYYAYDGKRPIRDARVLRLVKSGIYVILDVVVVPRGGHLSGRHLIIQDDAGLIDLWPSQDSLSYRRVKEKTVSE